MAGEAPNGDVEEPKLVFVSVRGARPRRKVAISIPDKMTWDAFVQQIKAKLQVDAVGAINLASTGAPVTSLATLEDIDELIVDPSSASSAPPKPSATRDEIQPGPRRATHRVSAFSAFCAPSDLPPTCAPAARVGDPWRSSREQGRRPTPHPPRWVSGRRWRAWARRGWLRCGKPWTGQGRRKTTWMASTNGGRPGSRCSSSGCSMFWGSSPPCRSSRRTPSVSWSVGDTPPLGRGGCAGVGPSAWASGTYATSSSSSWECRSWASCSTPTAAWQEHASRAAAGCSEGPKTWLHLRPLPPCPPRRNHHESCVQRRAKRIPPQARLAQPSAGRQGHGCCPAEHRGCPEEGGDAGLVRAPELEVVVERGHAEDPYALRPALSRLVAEHLH